MKFNLNPEITIKKLIVMILFVPVFVLIGWWYRVIYNIYQKLEDMIVIDNIKYSKILFWREIFEEVFFYEEIEVDDDEITFE